MPHRLRGVGQRIVGRIAVVSDLKPHNISIGPTFGTDAGGTAVTINGTNIVSDGLAVTIGGASCTSVVFVDATTMTCVTPAGTAGARDVILTTVHGSDTQVGGFTYTVAGGIPSDAVFFSNWDTALGTGSAAVLDTDKTVPWEDLRGSPASVREIIATGSLDFPTTNVLKITAEWNGSGSSFAGPDIDDSLTDALPAIGDSIFYRVYLRVAVPDAFTADPLSHPYQDGPGGGSNTNWTFEVLTSTDGTWTHRWERGGIPWPNNRWSAPKLNKNQTYRFELQIKRNTSTDGEMHVRTYDSSDVLLYTDADYSNINSSATLASTPIFTFKDLNFLKGIRVGDNGLFGGVQGDFPFIMFHWGAHAMRTDDWCGPFSNGF